MSLSLARLDLTQIFCDVDDFYREFERFCERDIPRLPCDGQPKGYQSRLSISEVMTIVIAFHGSGYRTFKDFYTSKVLPDWRDAFPHLVSYGRFVELMPWSFMALTTFLNTRCLGEVTGISFIDSTSVSVCHVKRAKAHKTFKGLADWGKSSVGWYFGFKLHLIINDRGELLAATLTPGNTDDRKPVREMTKDLVGKLFGDRGYISQGLFEALFERGLELITKRRKNMKNALMPLLDKILLRKRPLIETVNDQLKNLCQIEHSRHRSPFNFLVNLVSGLIAYAYHPNKPSLGIPDYELKALPQSAF
jgi:IS5 family transposase